MELSIPSEELARAISGLGKCLIAKDDLTEAKKLIEGVDSEVSKSPHIESLRSAINLLDVDSSQHDLEDLNAELSNDEGNLSLRYALAEGLIAKGNNELAIEELLKIISSDRDWNDRIARKKILELFKALGDNHALTIEGRSKLSSILFA